MLIFKTAQEKPLRYTKRAYSACNTPSHHQTHSDSPIVATGTQWSGPTKWCIVYEFPPGRTTEGGSGSGLYRSGRTKTNKTEQQEQEQSLQLHSYKHGFSVLRLVCTYRKVGLLSPDKQTATVTSSTITAALSEG